MSVIAIQIMSILYFVFALRMKIWRTSLNSFVVVLIAFLIVVSRENAYCAAIWTEWHLSLVAIGLTFVMGRVAFQSIIKKHKHGVEH